MRKKKVLHIIENMSDGGAQRVILDYLERKDSLQKYDLEFLSLSTPTNSTYDKFIKQKHLPFTYLEYKRSNMSFSCMRKVINWTRRIIASYRLIKERNVDALHTHITPIFINLIVILIMFKGEKFHTMHSDPYRFSKRSVMLFRFVFKYLNVHPVAVSEAQCTKAIKRYGLFKCDLLRNSVDIAGIQKCVGDLDKIALRKKYGLPIKGKIIGSVGRLHPVKNYDLLIKIFDSYRKSNLDDLYLVIAGDGPEFGNLKRLICELNLENNVFLIGNMEHREVYEFYKMIDLFMLLSRSEASSIVTLEAQAVGVRCLLSNNIPADVVYRRNVRRMDLSSGISVWRDAIDDDVFVNMQVYDKKDNDLSTVMERLEKIYDKYL